ncbi:MAG: DNA polymerase III subunit beta [Spirochaetaceae bacterium]|nr:DNA polymerase III subunit beta [Spirochaetaceae bacterium]MDT8297284.1 DNA polymerase III subunit beta [Spirochaetaceae bacterium]
MRFSCDKNVILKEISVAQEIIASRNALSILSNVLLEAEGDSLTIKATDLKVSFETRIPVVVEAPGNTTVFCDKLLAILRTLPDGEVKFIQDDGDRLTITDGKNINFQLHSISADKFPEIPETDENSFFAIPQKDFIDMVAQTIFAISDDETRYFMNGVYMEKGENRLVMVATDGRRLSYISNNPEGQVPEFDGIIIPPKVLNLVRKLASGEGELNLAVADKILYIRFDNQKVTSTLIDGQFPNYSRVIPENQDYEVQVNRSELISALRRVSLLAEQKSKRIYLTISAGKLNLRSEESEIGVAEESIDCRYEGPSSDFALNHVYLSDPLKVMEDEEVSMKFTETNKAITLVSVPESSYFHIVMPMQMD